MQKIWILIFRVAGMLLAASAVVFMSVPTASDWKRVSGVVCAALGSICIVAMYFSKKSGAQEEIHLVKKELEHYPPGTPEHDLDGAQHDVDSH
jgi:hypothetical protein